MSDPMAEGSTSEGFPAAILLGLEVHTVEALEARVMAQCQPNNIIAIH